MTQPQDDQQYIDEYIERTRLKAIDTSSTSAQSLPMSSSYRHQRLPSEPCIRLLFPELPERDEEDFLCYNLCTIRLSDKPLYAALSYTWGSPGYDVSHPYEIRVNGQYMTVTPNLWTAMSNLKTSRPEYILWVDAICINQNDNDERSAQVNIMDQIFSNAFDVIVWLGPEDADTPELAELIKQIAKVSSLLELDKTSVNEPRMSNHAAEDPFAVAQYGLPPITRNQWMIIVRFLDRPWFSRVWVIQEAALAASQEKRQNLHLLVGSHTILRNDVGWVAAFLFATGLCHGLVLLKNQDHNVAVHKRMVSPVGARMSGIMNISNICQQGFFETIGIRKLHERIDGLSPRQYNYGSIFLYIHADDCEASDPRDSIFAYIGILKRIAAQLEMDVTLIPPADYSRTVEEVYTSMSIFVLQQSQHLKLLNLIPDSTQMWQRNLPSWVLDWSAKRNNDYQIFGCEDEATPRFDVLHSRPEPLTLKISEDRRILTLKAAKIDTITDIGEGLCEYYEQGRIFQSISLLLKVPPIYHLTQQTRLDAFWRTWVSDQTFLEHPAPPSLQHSFHKWFRYILATGLVHSLASSKEAETAYLEELAILDTLAASDESGQCPTFKEIAADHDWVSREDEDARAQRRETEGFDSIARRFGMKRIFATGWGMIGLSSRSLRVGDEVWVLAGARTPFVLRRLGGVDVPPGGGAAFRLVGDAYVHGIMHGELFVDEAPMWEEVSLV